MEGNLFINKINSLFSWITKLAYLNALWLLFSLIGFIVIGFFPATVAMLEICRKWLNGERDIPLFKTFRNSYKSAFLPSNMIGWIFTAVGILLYLNFLVLQANTGQINFFAVSAFYLFLFFYLVTASHVLPVYVHYRVPVISCIRNAFIIGLVNMHFSLAILISQSAFVYLMFSYPSSAVFFLGSILSVIQMWIVIRSFRRIDRKVTKEKSVEVYA